MILYILRHGIAEDAPPPRGGDEARRLTPRGRDRVRAAAAGMRAFGLKFDVILTSPMARAAETAELVAAAYSGALSPQKLAALSAGVAPAETLTALKPYERHENVMVVGHEPGLSSLASLLLTGSASNLALDLKKCGLVALELPNGLGRGGARLCWMLTPRQLRRLCE
jgi:phosphohistidine phosphatase